MPRKVCYRRHKCVGENISPPKIVRIFQGGFIDQACHCQHDFDQCNNWSATPGKDLQKDNSIERDDTAEEIY